MSKLAQLIPAHINKARKDATVTYILTADENDLQKIWVLARNLDTDESPEWAGGHFLFQLRLPNDFPISPPKFVAYNKNGVYETGTEAICISIGHYHVENWRPALGLGGFIREIVNGMIHREFLIEKGGLGLLSSTSDEIIKYSTDSLDGLKEKYPNVISKMQEEFAEYSKSWDLTEIPENLRNRVPF